ncbi:cell division protein ZapA [Aquimonas voraii]|uniref:Cell division protein ZapA n=1 Tax=Aquimonas voraii TaxID=265719 RepID=A0A1G6X843_9GAMM|nr:cell division protein ZapA [Aquimonas voraii]SDD74311.1 cell division protein ZapA [Aquimonas voraii]
MTDPVNLRVLDREFLVACKPEERAGLVASAEQVDRQLRELRRSHPSATVDRLAVLMALNLTHELNALRQSQRERDARLERSLTDLNHRLDALMQGAALGLPPKPST